MDEVSPQAFHGRRTACIHHPSGQKGAAHVRTRIRGSHGLSIVAELYSLTDLAVIGIADADFSVLEDKQEVFVGLILREAKVLGGNNGLRQISQGCHRSWCVCVCVCGGGVLHEEH